MNDAAQNFLLAFSALFSIVNPIGGALIFAQITAERSHRERVLLARQIGLYSACVMLGALWVGAWILGFFGITLAALRIAGGLVVAFFAWQLLQAPEKREEQKQGQALAAQGLDDVAFYPLTMPFTTGPGTISVAVALGSNLPPGTMQHLAHVLGATAATLAMAVIIWLSYAFADRIAAWLGPTGVRVVARLAAFILLCIGVQIMLSGIAGFARSL